MDIQKFQQKLTEVCELGEKNGKVLKPEHLIKRLPVLLSSEASGIRTPDNLIKSQVLYQLS